MTASESREAAAQALLRIAAIARVGATAEAPLSMLTLRALLDDIAIYAERVAGQTSIAAAR